MIGLLETVELMSWI